MTTYSGVDVAADVSEKVGCLVRAGAAFIARYGAYRSALLGKILTRAEAQAISGAGCKIVPVWENGSPTETGYFTTKAGLDDALWCLGWAREISIPPGAVIYFTVDYDASFAAVESAIHPYFLGIEDVFSRFPQFGYGVGVYGSGMVCANVINSAGNGTLISNWASPPRPFAPKLGWLARPKDWQGYHDFVKHPECRIVQSALTAEQLACGLPSDRSDGDTAQGDDYGGFQVPVAAMA
jgi:hypothetical protein